MTVGQCLELYKILSNLKSAPGSHREYAQAKTLRKMKPFIEWYNDKIEAIDIDNCLTEDRQGQKILVKQILKVTNGARTEEVAVPSYSKEGEEKRAEAKRVLLKQPSQVLFDIHCTSDIEGLTAYEKITLEELKFISEPPKD